MLTMLGPVYRDFPEPGKPPCPAGGLPPPAGFPAFAIARPAFLSGRGEATVHARDISVCAFDPAKTSVQTDSLRFDNNVSAKRISC